MSALPRPGGTASKVIDHIRMRGPSSCAELAIALETTQGAIRIACRLPVTEGILLIQTLNSKDVYMLGPGSTDAGDDPVAPLERELSGDFKASPEGRAVLAELRAVPVKPADPDSEDLVDESGPDRCRRTGIAAEVHAAMERTELAEIHVAEPARTETLEDVDAPDGAAFVDMVAGLLTKQISIPPSEVQQEVASAPPVPQVAPAPGESPARDPMHGSSTVKTMVARARTVENHEPTNTHGMIAKELAAITGIMDDDLPSMLTKIDTFHDTFHGDEDVQSEFICALFSNGRLFIKSGVIEWLLTKEETRQLAKYIVLFAEVES